MTEYRRPEPFDRVKHQRGEFTSTSPELNDWLHRYATQNRRRKLSAVWVIADRDHTVVAYATLSMTAVDRSAAPKALASGAPNPVPAVLLGRLAVDADHEGAGLGTALVEHCLAVAVATNQEVACRAIIVNALDEPAFEWWQRLGFRPLDPHDPDSLDHYLLTKEAEDVLDRLAGPPA